MQVESTRTLITATTAASLLALRAWKKRQLTPAGCVAAWFVGFVSTANGAVHFAALFCFFFTSTRLTKVGAKRKAKLEEGYHSSGNRSIWQVLCNGGIATTLLGGVLLGAIPSSPAVHLAAVAHYAACQGDTWSSELGVLSSAEPRLICGLRRVPAGTNGGVTLMGFGAAALGGAVLGVTCAAANTAFPIHAHVTGWQLMIAGTVGGIAGSVVDSVLGQFFQLSVLAPDGKVVSDEIRGGQKVSGRPILSNNQVNLLSAAAVTAAVFSIVARTS